MSEKQVRETPIKKPLPADPLVSELFQYFDMEGAGVRVAPVTIQEDPQDTRLLFLVRGEHTTASLIFAALYERLEELSAVEQQQEANRGGSGLITP